MKSSWNALIGAGLSSIALQACSANSQDVAEAAPSETAFDEEARDLIKVADIPFDNGSVLEFYEGGDGTLVLSGAGPLSSPPIALDRTLTAVELFQRLAPGRTVPQELLDAQVRANELAANAKDLERFRPERAARVPRVEVDEIGSVQQRLWGDDDSACPWDWFSTTRCLPGTQTCWGFLDGTQSAQHNDARYAIATTCNYRNGHNHLWQTRTWWSWGTQANWFVPPGTYRWTEAYGSLDFDARVTIQQTGAQSGAHLLLRSNTSGFRDYPH